MEEVRLEAPLSVRLIIGGEELGSSSGKQFTRENPADYRKVVTVAEESSINDVKHAIDVVYGLTASVWSSDYARALRVSKKIKAGTVWVQDNYTQPPEGIWGGYKQSGVGRELGPYGLEDFVEVKQIYVDGTGLKMKPHYRLVMKD